MSRVRSLTRRTAGVAALVCLLVSATASIAAGYGWNKVSTPATQSVNGVCFTNPDNGWIVGNNAAVFHTTDGGSTWATVTVDAGITTLEGVRFVDAGHGWITGQSGVVRFTEDGGSTWTAQGTGSGAALGRPFVLDLQHAWIPVPGAGGLVIRNVSSEGWQFGLNGAFDSMFDVSFPDALNGWAVGSGGAIYRTADGGETWIPKTKAGFTGWLYGVSAVDTQCALAVSSSGDVLYTEDGGTQWALTSGVAPALYTVKWTDFARGEAWAAGYGTIVHTNDWGYSWQAAPASGVTTVKDLSFPDALSGYAACDDGSIMKYSPPIAPVANNYDVVDDEGLWVSWTASPDAATYQVRRGGSTQSGILATQTSMASLPLGVSTYQVRALSVEGLPSEWSTGTITNRDVAAPTLVSETPVTSPTVSVSWNDVIGAVSYEYRVNGAPEVATTSTQATFSLEEGLNVLEVRAKSERTTSAWAVVTVTRIVQRPQVLILSRSISTATYPTRSVRLGGTTGGHATTVTVESRVMGASTWTPTGVVIRSSDTGVIPPTTVPLKARTYYRIRSAGDIYYAPALSTGVYVRYKPFLKAPVVPVVRRGRSFTAYTYAYTPMKNSSAVVKFRLYRWSASTHRWRWYKTVTATRGTYSTSRSRTLYKAKFKITRSGTWKVKVYYDGKTLYNDTTKYRNFKVR